MQTKEKVSQIIDEIEDKNVAVQSLVNETGDQGKDKQLFDDLVLGKNAVTGEDSNLRVELGEANAHIDTTLQRQFGGNKFTAGIKKIIWKIMAKPIRPMFQEQNLMNHHLVASLNELNRMRGEHEVEINHLREAIVKLNSQNDYLASRVQSLQKVVDEFDIPHDGGLSDFEYEDFENHFRGPMEEIKERLKMYVPYFKDADAPIFEIGSGRGEFLELMKENNITASGIDIFRQFVNKCLRNGLDVQYGDGISFIKHFTSDSLSGVFASQVVEHISNSDIIELYRESFRVLKKGGYCIFETPNPCCVSMFTGAFYIDPSHKKPIHPLYLEYIARLAGFTEVEIVFTEGSRTTESLPTIKTSSVDNIDEVNEAINKLSEKIYGSQDYAIIARKM